MEARTVTLLVLFLSLTVQAETQLVKIPAGQIQPFWLASASKISSKKDDIISVGGFEAQIYPVTKSEFAEFLKRHPEWKKDEISSLFADEAYLLKFGETDARAPVTYVSWFAAKAYCDEQGLRLPTTNEWEYMAAASEKVKNAAADPVYLKRILDWYSDPNMGKLPKVGSVYKNLYGVWDLHGLIWEWVEDFNSNLVTGESREDSSFNRDLFCGAGTMGAANKEDYAAFMRYAFRASLKGKSAVWNLGFRCVRSL